MNEEEIKHDIDKFEELRNSINSIWEELETDCSFLEENNSEDFTQALNEATDIVDNLSGYYDELKRNQIYNLECDWTNRKDKNRKLIIKTKKEELDDVLFQVEEFTKKPMLSNLFLEVTLRCNAKCEHCGSSCGYKIPKDEISIEDLKRTILEVHDRYGSENVFLTVTGGEPLMRKDLFEIMKYATDLGFHWGMTSNAMLITEEVIKKLRETNFESISISLDGLRETHDQFRKVPGGFDKVLRAVKLLQNLETLKHLQITTVANKKNIHELEDIYQLLLDLGIKEWRVATVDPIGRAIDNKDIMLDKDDLIYKYNFIREKRLEGKMLVEDSCSHYLGFQFENILRDHGFVCGAGLFVGSILSNGDICVCPNVRRKELVQGNIKTDHFVDVWENRFQDFRENRITMVKNEKCKKCKSFKYCRGDSFHTWNFDENVPNVCMKDILGKDFIE